MRKGFLIAGIMAISLICSGFSYKAWPSGVTLEVNEDYTMPGTEIGDITLDGKGISLPCRVSLIEDLGYVVDEERTYKPNNRSYSVYAYDAKGRKLSLSAVNLDNTTRDIKDCVLWGINYEIPKDDSEPIDIRFSGVSVTSPYSSFSSLFGSESLNFSYDDGGRHSEWYTLRKDKGVDVDYEGDRVTSVSVNVDIPEGNYTFIGEDDVNPIEDGGNILAVILIIAVIGVPVFIVGMICFVIFYHVKRSSDNKKAEIDARILDKSLDDYYPSMDDKDLKDKYK